MSEYYKVNAHAHLQALLKLGLLNAVAAETGVDERSVKESQKARWLTMA